MTCHCPLVELWVKSFFRFSRRLVWLQGLRSTWESFLKSKINVLHSDPILWFELCLARKRGSLPDLTLKGAVRKGATQRWQRSFESQTCMVCSSSPPGKVALAFQIWHRIIFTTLRIHSPVWMELYSNSNSLLFDFGPAPSRKRPKEHNIRYTNGSGPQVFNNHRPLCFPPHAAMRYDMIWLHNLFYQNRSWTVSHFEQAAAIKGLLHGLQSCLGIVPQQRKLMDLQPRIAPVCIGAGAGSGSTRFRKRFQRLQSQVTFNRVLEKVPEKVPGSLGAKPSQVQQGSAEGSGEGSGEGQVRFNRVAEKVPEKVLGRLWCRRRVRFNEVPEKVPEVAEPGHVQQGSGEGSREGSRKPWCQTKSGSTGFRRRFGRRFRRRARSGSTGLRRRFQRRFSGGFGAEPGQVQQGSGEGSGEGSGRLWCRARSGSTGFRRRFWRRSARLWCRARSGSTGFRRMFRSQVRFEEGSGEGLGGFGAEPGQVQQDLRPFPAEVFPAPGFAARFRKICEFKTLRLWGIPPKLIFWFPCSNASQHRT